MVNKNITWVRVGLIGLIAIIGISLFLHVNSEKRHIKHQFKRLSDTVALASGEGLIAHGIKSNRAGDLFAEEATLNIPVNGLSGRYSRNEIVRNVLIAKNMCEQLSLDFFDLTIDIPKQAQAIATTTARVKGRTHSGETINEVRELHCQLNKVDGRWLFTDCTLDSIITR